MVIMMLAGGAAGLLSGLLLGRIAAMLLTSLLGGAGVVASLVSFAVRLRPEWGGWLAANRQYLLAAAGALALVFLAKQTSRRAASRVIPVLEVAESQDKS